MTIGVMVDGQDRPAAVLGRVAARPSRAPTATSSTSGSSRAARSRRCCGDLPVGHADADDRPEGQVHARARRRPDAHLHLVGDGQRAVRLDDAAAARSTARPRPVVFLNGVSYAHGARLPRPARGLGARAASTRSRTCRRSRGRTIRATPAGRAAPVASSRSSAPVLDELGPRRRPTRSPTSAATRT